MKTHNRHSATLAAIFAALALLLATHAPAQSISLTASTGYQTAIALSYSSPVITGNNLSVTVQITNTSGTWVYLQQDQTYSANSPVVLPYTVYLLGPGASKAITNVNFQKNTYLQFNVTTPIGLDFTTLATDPKPRALFGAMIVDCMTRGLLTFPLPANAFDEPFNGATGVVDPVLDNIVSTLQQDGSSLGSAAVDLKNRDWVKLSWDFGQIGSQIASESSALQNSISQLLQRANIGVSSGDVGTFFSKASSWAGIILEVLDLPAKYTLLHDISISTFGAPPSSWNRFDVVVAAQTPSVSYVSPSSFTGLPIGQTRLVRIIGSSFISGSTLTFNDGTTSYPGRVPTFVSASELDYNITTGTNQANWTVRVFNGAQQSNLGTFTVNAPSPSTGSITVNITPSGAVSAGAQWRVDNGSYLNNGDVALGLSPGSHTVSLKSVSGYNTPTNLVLSVVANQQITVNAIYAAIASCSYSLSSSGDIWAAAGGDGAFNVIAPAGCIWAASENLSWVTITSGSSGNGTHGVFYQVDYNPSISPRSGVITAAGQSFTITQNGNSGACTFALSAPGANMPAEGGSNSFSVITGPSCFWAISRNANWITLTSPQDHTGNDSVQYTVQPYSGSEPRSAAILLSTDGGQTFVATFTITQAGTPPPPGTLATGLSYPVNVAVDDNYAYWIEASGKVLKRVSKSGGAQTTLATSPSSFGQMVLDGNYLYYLDSGTKVQKLLKSGGTPTTLATGSSFYDGITVQNNTVFWGASGVIYSVPITGGSATSVATSSQDIASIRVTNNVVYWSQTYYPASLFAQPIGGSRTTLSSGVNVEPGLAIQDGFVYFAGSENIYRVPIGGGARQTLASGLNDAYDLALDATNIYWVEAGNPTGTNGSVRQMPLTGGAIITLATNLAQPVAIAIDSTNVYWLERNNGQTTRSALKWAAKASTVSDVVSPSISITNPADGARLNESLLSVNGTAADNISVALVELQLNGGTWQTATGTTTWTGSVNLVSATNTIQARSRDSAGNYSAIASILVTYSPPDTKLPQAITFGALSDQVFGDAPFALWATSSSGLPVYLNVLSGPAALDTNNVLTLLGAGTVTVIAWQPGNSNYNAAITVQRSFNVTQSFVVPPPDNTIVNPQRLPNGSFQLAFFGLTGSNYTLQTSSNLINWQTLTNFIGTNSLLYFSDPAATNFKQRFYRTVRP